MTECEHGLPCPCLACSRPCRKKVGWITGDVYCATHGRDKGWPCPGYIHEPQRPIPWHVGDDGEALCVPSKWRVSDARRFGKLDANGAVMYECPLCDYMTGPHRADSSRANEARRQHMRDKHGVRKHEHDVSCAFGSPTCPAFGES